MKSFFQIFNIRTAILAVIACFICNIQSTAQESEYNHCLRIGYSRWQDQAVEIGINHVFDTKHLMEWPVIYDAAFLSAGVGRSSASTFYTAHVGYEYYRMLLGFRAGMTMQTDLHRTTIGILPEAGLTMIGLVSIMYGYNLPLYSDHPVGLLQHRISCSINIPFIVDDKPIWKPPSPAGIQFKTWSGSHYILSKKRIK